jgi:hypothetical protein
MILVEFCAGSAAVSLRWLSMAHKAPFGYAGGKRGYADQILAVMGCSPGGAVGGDSVVLVEPGPWGEAWDHLRSVRSRNQIIDRIRVWEDNDPRALWMELASAAVPSHPLDRVTTWLVLMYWSYACKPVFPLGSKWRHHGFDSVSPYRTDIARAKRAEGKRYEIAPNKRLGALANTLEALDLRGVASVQRSIAEVEFRDGGEVVYIDPPYRGTTCAYGHDLPRNELLELASTVGMSRPTLVSEAEPLPLPGWFHIELSAPRGRGRNNFSKQQREFLTLSPLAAARCPDYLLYPGLV